MPINQKSIKMIDPDSQAAKKEFIVFSDDWGIHPSSCQHLFRHIAKENRVSWINTIGMRSPKVTMDDLRKAFRKVSGMFRGDRKAEQGAAASGIDVRQPLMLPFSNFSVVREFNRKSVARTMRGLKFISQSDLPIIVTTVPNSCDYVDAIPSQKIVYYCVDDFSEWPGLDKSLILKMEEMLIQKADIFVATSKRLYDRLAKTGKPTHLLTHGVDIELFSSVAPEEHASLRDIPIPRVGYFGLFDERSDQSLICEVAQKMPDVSFVIAGRVETDVSMLRKLKNVHLVGPIEYYELPSLIKGMRALFLPYVVNQLSKSLSPLKFKEYLATGIPVVSTPIAAARETAEAICIAGTVEDWERFVRKSVGNQCLEAHSDMIVRLAKESWSRKADQLVRICHGDWGGGMAASAGP